MVQLPVPVAPVPPPAVVEGAAVGRVVKVDALDEAVDEALDEAVVVEAAAVEERGPVAAFFDEPEHEAATRAAVATTASSVGRRMTDHPNIGSAQ